MSEVIGRLFEVAAAVRERAYVPYSEFKVGAAILADDGAVYAGCNVENASYPVSVCAEGGAVSVMIAAGAHRIREILVVGGGEGWCTPCGACRQRIREFALGLDTPVHVARPDGATKSFTLGELLPESFGPGNLGK